MKSSTARWTTAIAAAACLAVPTAGLTQTPATSQPPTTQQQPSKQQPPSASQPSGEAQEHLRQAQAAVKDIPATIPAPAKSRIAELKRHLNALEKSSSAPAPGATAAKKSNWSTEVAAIDKILTELLGPASGSGSSEPTGTTGAAGATGSKSRSTTAMTLDETTKSKLLDVRQHVTAYAAAMSGTSGGAASAPSSEPAATEPAAAAASQPPASQSNPSAPSPSSAAQPEPTAPAAGQPPAAQNPASAEQAQQPTASTGQQADPETSKRHLTAARESLSQLTQLPAAAQLSGEPRTQVSQLISNFNELITTKENWRASYDKVEANVTALLGPEAAGETAQAPPAPTGGAVGTTGTTAASLDPAIRAKLVEFRAHLKQFEQAAGVSDQASSPASTPSAAASSSTSSMAGQSPAGQSAAGQPTGTTGTTDTPQSASAPQQPASTMGQQDDAVRHIEAIEAILKGSSSSGSSTPGATAGNAPAGTTGTTTGNITLNQSQVEEIRMHLAELRKAVDKK